MAVTQPIVRSNQQPLVDPRTGLPTRYYFDYLKSLEIYIKTLETRIAALEAA